MSAFLTDSTDIGCVIVTFLPARELLMCEMSCKHLLAVSRLDSLGSSSRRPMTKTRSSCARRTQGCSARDGAAICVLLSEAVLPLGAACRGAGW